MTSRRGEWMSFDSVVPSAALHLAYAFGDRTVTLSVEDAERSDDRGVTQGYFVQANVHRDVEETRPQERIEAVQRILTGWRRDVADTARLVGTLMERTG